MSEKVKLTEEQVEVIGWIHDQKQYEKVITKVVKGINFTNPRFRWLSDLGLEKVLKVIYEPNSYEVGTEYKVEDWVKQDVGDGFRIGKITQIYDNKRVLVGFMEYESLFKSYQEAFDTDEISLATLEEIEDEQERQIWNKIGREVGEFKIGDVRIMTSSPRIVTQPFLAKNEYEQGDLQGFYPVESFIKF